MKKEEINEFIEYMTLQEKKDKIIEIIHEIPEDSPIHKELQKTLKREMEGKQNDPNVGKVGKLN